MRINFDTSDFDKQTLRLIIQVENGATQALRDMTNAVKEQSIKEAPLLEGDLRATFFRENQIHGHRKEAVISYDTPYAAYQHEGVRKDGTHVIRRHTTAGTKTKYLEDPVKSLVSQANAIIKKAIFG